MGQQILNEAKRLHSLGFGILLLNPQSKTPKNSGWTTGPRLPWTMLEKDFVEGDNIGVRLGDASKIGENYLACIDVDVKDPNYKTVAHSKLLEIIGDKKLPTVESGSGNGSMHLYCVTPKPFQMITAAKEKHKYEIVIYSSGRQMVLSPSIHPNGKPYKWRRPLLKKESLPVFAVEHFEDFRVSGVTHNGDGVNTRTGQKEKTNQPIKDFEFEVVAVDLLKFSISEKLLDMLISGAGVTDRSSSLLPVASALYRAGATVNEILSILTDDGYYLGSVAFDHAKTLSRTKAALWVYRYTLKKIIDESSAEKMFEVPHVPTPELTFDEMGAQAEIFEDLDDWRLTLDTTDKGNYRNTIRNVVTILEKDESVGADFIKRDLFAYRDFYSKSTPWGGKKGAALTDDDTAKIRYWFSMTWGFEPTLPIVETALTVLADKNSFDPLVDWLGALPEWDGIERIDGWLAKNFSAKGDSEYLAQVFRKWLCAMVLRILKPGTKFDWMPIFEGHQGAGKSSFGEILVGKSYFLDWLPDLANKDSALALQGHWAVEMGELAAFSRNELEALKAYVTRTVDKVRPPYGRKTIEAQRRCVFFGTTNKENYLRDDTGNRRFKPVKVGKLNFDRLHEEREQLFAEALFLIESGFETVMTLNLDGDARIFEHQIQKEKMVQDDSFLMIEALKVWLNQVEKMPEKDRPDLDKISMKNLFENNGFLPGTLPLKSWRFEMKSTKLAAKALRALGFTDWKHHGIWVWSCFRDPTTKARVPGKTAPSFK